MKKKKKTSKQADENSRFGLQNFLTSAIRL